MARTPQDITEAELDVLQVLWDDGPATIRQLTDVLRPGGGSAQYATVQKLLDRLEFKGYVRRDRSGTAHSFSSAVGRDEVIGRRLRDVAEKLCGGSLTPLLTHLVRTRRLNARERQELRALIDELDGKSKAKTKRIEGVAMDTLLQIALSNAVVAGGLTLIVAGVGVVWRRPALLHSLWLLVLLKLITPPLIWVPVPWPVQPATFAQAPPAAVEPEPAAEAVVPRVLVETTPATAGVSDEADALHEPLGVEIPPTMVYELRPPATPAPALLPPDWLEWWQPAIVGTWLTGSALWFVCALCRLRGFRRLLRHARLAPVQLQKQAQRLARKLGMASAPTVYLVPGRLSPLLWACLGSPRLVLPAALLEHIDEEQRATLILHELAHLRRRDHWVRALEFIAMGLYWWNPVVWFARRELREAEEMCCDAWVVSALPQANRTYATALVETIDFLSAAPAPVPLLASGVGPISDLKRRLTMIMRGTTPRTLSWRGALLVLGLGMFLLPMLPAFAQAQDKKERPDDPSAALRQLDVELLDDYELLAAAGSDQAELQKLKAQLEQKVQELRETEAKIQDVRAKLRQIDGGKSTAKDLKATYRLLVQSAKGGEPQEIILRQVDGKWQTVDAKTVKLETLRTITVNAGDAHLAPFVTRDGKTVTAPSANAPAKPARAQTDVRIDELERKLEKVLKVMEQLKQDMQPRRPMIDRGFFPQDGKVGPPVIDPGFGPAEEAGRPRLPRAGTPLPIPQGGKPLQP